MAININKFIISLTGLIVAIGLIWAAFQQSCPDQKIVTEVQGIKSETVLSSMLSRSTCLFADRDALIMSTIGIGLLFTAPVYLFKSLMGE